MHTLEDPGIAYPTLHLLPLGMLRRPPHHPLYQPGKAMLWGPPGLPRSATAPGKEGCWYLPTATGAHPVEVGPRRILKHWYSSRHLWTRLRPAPTGWAARNQRPQESSRCWHSSRDDQSWQLSTPVRIK